MNWSRPATCFGLFAIAVLAASGCSRNRYQIEMSRDGDALRRELTVWLERRSSDGDWKTEAPAKAELERIAEAYGDEVPESPEGKQTFVGRFIERMPEGVGGSGTFTRWSNSLGSVSGYVERFRGDDDLVDDVENRLRAADRLADLLKGWLTSELEGQPGVDRLGEFLDGPFRRDLKNVSLYSWSHAIAAQRSGEFQPGFAIRLGQYLHERGYFTADELPSWTRAVQASSKGDAAPLLQWMRRLIATRMDHGAEAADAEAFSFLSSKESVQASARRYFRQTEDYQRLLDRWKRESNQGDRDKPRPEEVLSEPLSTITSMNQIFGNGDRLEVALETETEPLWTNGEWNQPERKVVWSKGIEAADATGWHFPAMLYAIWSIPNETTQRRHFGDVILEGESLARYCLWYEGLSDEETRQWDEFVASWKPRDDLSRRLQTFTFAEERTEQRGGAGDYDPISTARQLFSRALNNNGPAEN